jgi:hypothetical protein
MFLEFLCLYCRCEWQLILHQLCSGFTVTQDRSMHSGHVYIYMHICVYIGFMFRKTTEDDRGLVCGPCEWEIGQRHLCEQRTGPFEENWWGPRWVNAWEHTWPLFFGTFYGPYRAGDFSEQLARSRVPIFPDGPSKTCFSKNLPILHIWNWKM